MRTLYVRERSLYLMRSFTLSQCRDLRTEIKCEIKCGKCRNGIMRTGQRSASHCM